MSALAQDTLSDAPLSGAQRAAILVMYLDQDVAKSVLENLSDAELERVGEAMSEVHTVDPQTIERVVEDFVHALHDACLVPRTGPEFAIDVLPTLVDDERRRRVISPIRRRLSHKLASEVERHPAAAVAAILQDEHPQTGAVALLLMGDDNAARILDEFADELRTDIAFRMARIERIPTDLADDVEHNLLTALTDADDAGGLEVEGLSRTAKILGRLHNDSQRLVLDGIATSDTELSDLLRRRMVVFEDLTGLDDRSMQAVLKSVEREKLIIALRGTSDALLQLVLRNMSSRAAQDMREEIELLGPKPKNLVEAAREEVVQTVLHLREEGAVSLSMGTDDEMM